MEYPCLRPIDFQPVHHQGEQMWLLRDPAELSERQLIMPPPLAQLLTFCDGTNSLQAIHQKLQLRLGDVVPFHVIEDVVKQLDDVYLLKNARSDGALKQQQAEYLELAARPPAFAGLNYPADPDELSAFLAAYGADDDRSQWSDWHGRGIISPHIDYQRGGTVYSKVWERARAAVEAADLVLMFGTDHNGGHGSLTLTRVPYATPYGTIPTDLGIVDQLADAIGPDAYQLELNHRREHSIELSAVWWHALRGDRRGSKSCPMVPILCGSYYHFTPNGHPNDDPRMGAFIEALKRATEGRRVLAVASVDFAHVGPAFDSGYDMDAARREQLALTDASLREAIRAGDAERFYREIAPTRNANNVCGFSSIYLMLRYLGAVDGVDIAYTQCEADSANTSVVSIAGMLLK